MFFIVDYGNYPGKNKKKLNYKNMLEGWIFIISAQFTLYGFGEFINSLGPHYQLTINYSVFDYARVYFLIIIGYLFWIYLNYRGIKICLKEIKK